VAPKVVGFVERSTIADATFRKSSSSGRQLNGKYVQASGITRKNPASVFRPTVTAS
jgi:hypothetical protein